MIDDILTGIGRMANSFELVRCRLCAGSHEVPPYRVGHVSGSCEWETAADRAAKCDDVFHAHAKVIVGANGQWRLCAECASLARFARFKKRRIER